jgi:hypothetical protein
VLRLHYDLASVERGPLPPHERTWRHPSELAAEERAAARAEAAAPSTRVFAITTGTIGLLAVGVLILTVSPRRQESPIAISATTSPVAATTAGSDGEGLRALAPAALSSTVSTRPGRLVEGGRAEALATPIGDGRFAVVTGRALAGHDQPSVDVEVASGRVVAAEIVSAADDHVVLVALADAEPGHSIARHRPEADDVVTVMASPPITVAYGDVDALDIDEGTAVLDVDGRLVGLCSRSRVGGRVHVLDVTESLSHATSADR